MQNMGRFHLKAINFGLNSPSPLHDQHKGRMRLVSINETEIFKDGFDNTMAGKTSFVNCYQLSCFLVVFAAFLFVLNAPLFLGWRVVHLLLRISNIRSHSG